MLMSRRRRGQTGRPPWLDERLHELVGKGLWMERVKPEQPSGYVLRDKDAVAELLAVEAELLRSEGLDPKWPGFAPSGKAESGPSHSDGA